MRDGYGVIRIVVKLREKRLWELTGTHFLLVQTSKSIGNHSKYSTDRSVIHLFIHLLPVL